jgi:hypothetical protein
VGIRWKRSLRFSSIALREWRERDHSAVQPHFERLGIRDHLAGRGKTVTKDEAVQADIAQQVVVQLAKAADRSA